MIVASESVIGPGPIAFCAMKRTSEGDVLVQSGPNAQMVCSVVIRIYSQTLQRCETGRLRYCVPLLVLT